MPNILETIVAEKRREVDALPPTPVSPERIARILQDRGGPRDVAAALRQAAAGPAGIALIAEVKKASPSAGVIRPDFHPVAIARDYASAGAACLSVLTDVSFFQGAPAYLRDIRAAVPLPLLRKDFLIDPRQILEAATWGADAILLIVAILDDARLADFHALATAAGLAVLVEVHDEAELDRALACGARLIGVNNRDLRSFKVDLATTERLAARLWRERSPTDTLLVAESGIHTHGDLRRLAACGAGAVLVGESLMRHPDIPAKVRELLGTPSAASPGGPS